MQIGKLSINVEFNSDITKDEFCKLIAGVSGANLERDWKLFKELAKPFKKVVKSKKKPSSN